MFDKPSHEGMVDGNFDLQVVLERELHGSDLVLNHLDSALSGAVRLALARCAFLRDCYPSTHCSESSGSGVRRTSCTRSLGIPASTAAAQSIERSEASLSERYV